MRIAEIIGTVTLSKWHPSLSGARWLLATPLSHAGLCGDASGRAEPLVVYDDRSAAAGDRIAMTESAEASAPFYPDQKPIDAYNAAILDSIDVCDHET